MWDDVEVPCFFKIPQNNVSVTFVKCRYYGVMIAFGGLQQVSSSSQTNYFCFDVQRVKLAVSNESRSNGLAYLYRKFLWHSFQNVILIVNYAKNVQYLKTQSSAKVTMLLERRVFPLYLMVAPSPYVLANANWMLGQLSNCLPEVRESLIISVSIVGFTSSLFIWISLLSLYSSLQSWLWSLDWSIFYGNSFSEILEVAVYLFQLSYAVF